VTARLSATAIPRSSPSPPAAVAEVDGKLQKLRLEVLAGRWSRTPGTRKAGTGSAGRRIGVSPSAVILETGMPQNISRARRHSDYLLYVVPPVEMR